MKLPTTAAAARERGLTRYFTGEPCRNGHVAERWSSDGSCMACRKEKLPRIRQQHRERRNQTHEHERLAAMARPPVNYDYENLKAFAQELGQSVETLVALNSMNDPFYILPSRRAAAEWFVQVLKDLGFTSKTHLRAVHYRFLSYAAGAYGPRGEPYENTQNCYEDLNNAGRDARYLGLVPFDLFDDRRNDEPIEHLCSNGEPEATLDVEERSTFTVFDAELSDWLPSPPDFQFEATPAIDQRYHVELWCEKSTMNTILLSLARRYDLNVVTAAGEFSVTHCHRLVQRATASGRPVRILYISDFDPAGVGMPVAASRKIEFLIRRDNLDLDVQVRQIALTHRQCVEYRLPRTPIKDERRAERFEGRFGEGATELDAMEGLHPGVLRRLIEQEVLRYYDTDLQERTEQAVGDFRDELENVR